MTGQGIETIEQTTRPRDAATWRVLLVEDSDTQALQFRYLLESETLAVDRAATAEAALEYLNERLPDLLIADYRLPGMNGDELARQIRLNVRTRALPVLMLTDSQERDVERQGLESGADAYVPKSADKDLLLVRIHALLRRQHAERGDGSLAEGDTRAGFTRFRRGRILIVEDRDARRAQLEKLLVQDGYDVRTAAGADDAMALSRNDVWDCVLVNVVSRSFDGLGLCARLNGLRTATASENHPADFQIVGLAGSGAVGKDVLAGVYSAGADDVIPDATSGDVLMLRVRAVVRRKLLQDEDRTIAKQIRERESAIANARAEAAALAAKASVAEELARANAELEETNRQLRDAQARLVQAAKMASLGELVAGIAHEINNPLAFSISHQGTIERLLVELETKSDDRKEAGNIIARCLERARAMRDGLLRIQGLVLNLRKFSRLDQGGFQHVNIPEAIETVLTLLAHRLNPGIEVLREYRAHDDLLCSPALLNQVVMNIVGNAADALGGNGIIRIATRNENESYIIEISDSGPGIPEELRERIFEPFFTTKPVGSGTGLGLAIAYSVVHAHKGSLAVGAAPGGGAQFTISIPVRDMP